MDSREAIPVLEHGKRADASDQPITPVSHEDAGKETSRKPLSFWLSFLALNISVFIVSLDSTALAVAVPVRSNQMSRRVLSESPC